MASRPIFIPKRGTGPIVERLDLEISWHGGFAASQKRKNIIALHAVAAKHIVGPILEISTKSEEELGQRLSAFSLKIEAYGSMKSLESVYQSSKVFEFSGQHEHLMDLNPFQAKKAIREFADDPIIAFRFEGREYPTEPKNAFYDWLYIRAIAPHEEWIQRNLKYAAYSDIEFTPNRSVNCQARAVAEYHALSMRGMAIECSTDFDKFRRTLQYAQRDDDSL